MNGNALKKEYGDYQTPLNFAHDICLYLKNQMGINPHIILEPTCGIGNFICASIDVFKSADKIYGIEINKDYCNRSAKALTDQRVKIVCDDFFTCKTKDVVKDTENILILGNPPWATNSEISINLPPKTNFKKLSGTDAITGASNFDICEYIILKLVEEFKHTNATIAMLCKTSVARNVFIEMSKQNIGADCVKIINFDAGKIFGVSTSACLFVISFSENGAVCGECQISDIERPNVTTGIIRYSGGALTNTAANVCDLDGYCRPEWRQGVKHDCSSIMELKKVGSMSYMNKNKEIVELEDSLIFPLMKSSNFKKAIIKDNFEKYVIVTQKKARADTSYISHFAPLTWKYLQENKEMFDNRKSSIYNGAPLFSMFGVGEYSYAKYKVGISGFYKKPLFSLLYNENDIKTPIMLDDTSYFISFDEYDTAYICMLLLNCEKVREFLYSISFKDAKRPYTKKVLQRLDLKKCVDNISIDDLIKTEKTLNLSAYANKELYDKAKRFIFCCQDMQLSMF